MEQKQTDSWGLTEEGEYMVKNGSHEAVVYHAIPYEGILQAELMVSTLPVT